jgi:hypothetical protein
MRIPARTCRESADTTSTLRPRETAIAAAVFPDAVAPTIATNCFSVTYGGYEADARSSSGRTQLRL